MTEGEFPHLELMKYDLFPRKLDPPPWPELRKGSDKCFALILSYVLQKHIATFIGTILILCQ